MRRWTILIIPHDTDEPRSFAVSERRVRWAGIGTGVVVLAAILGVAATGRWASRTRTPSVAEQQAAIRSAIIDSITADQLDSLRTTVTALEGALDTVRGADERLRAAAGLGAPDSLVLHTQAQLRGSRAAADSLLRGAAAVARRFGAMADSADLRTGVRGARPPGGASSRSAPALAQKGQR